MNSISWKAYHARCAWERVRGKYSSTAVDVVKFILNGRGREGADQETLARAVSMSTGIIADEVVKHWDDIEKALNEDASYIKMRNGHWCRKPRDGARRMHLK